MRSLAPLLVVACLGLLLVGARARDDVLVNEHGNFEQDNDIEVRYDTHDHDHDQDQATFSHFEFRESQSAAEPEHVLAEAQDESEVESDGSSWVTPQLQGLVQSSSEAQLLETKSRVFRSLHARTRRSARSYSSADIGPSASGSSLSSSSNIVTGSASSSGPDATLSSSITKQPNGDKTLGGSVNLPAGGGNSPGVINTGESRIHTDREGHHFIVLTNNNVLAQTVPDTAQQILAAAAAQSVAKQILDMARRRAVVQTTVVQEATSKSQVQTQSEQKREQEKVVEQKTSSEDKEKQDEAAKKRLIVTLQDPWVPYGGDYADPKASRVDNLCIVEGMLKGSEGHVATLGPDCRPIGRLTFALIRSGQVGRVDVLPDGRVHVIAGGNPGWLSLYGLAFTVGADKQPDLLDKWAPLANGFRPPTISKIGDLCLASGVLTTSTGSWDKGLIKAPMECYATERVIFNADNHDLISQVDLLPSGELMWQAGGKGHNWVSLDGVAWCVQEGGIALELDAVGGWSSFGKGFRRPKYCMVQGYCVLSGVIQNPKDWTGLIAKLPEACRPAKRSPFAVNAKAKMARVDVYPNGEVRYVDGAESGASFLSLDGVRFLSAQVGLQKSGTSVATQEPPGAVSTVQQPSAASAVKP